MGRRTDTRERIVRASLQQMRERGYAGTAISDIVTASGAPRGSITFHFPGGKDEIAREVIALRLSQIIGGIDASAANHASAAGFLSACFDAVAVDFAGSQFAAGCPVAPIALERSGPSSELTDACAAFFESWRGSIARHLTAYGVDPLRAERISALSVSAIEGALVISRTQGTVDALEAARDELRVLLPG